jgi:hypothetical protein
VIYTKKTTTARLRRTPQGRFALLWLLLSLYVTQEKDMHQTWVYAKESAALEGPMLGGGVSTLVPPHVVQVRWCKSWSIDWYYNLIASITIAICSTSAVAVAIALALSAGASASATTGLRAVMETPNIQTHRFLLKHIFIY